MSARFEFRTVDAKDFDREGWMRRLEAAMGKEWLEFHRRKNFQLILFETPKKVFFIDIPEEARHG